MITKQTQLIMNWNTVLILFSLGIICFLFDFIIYGFVFSILFLVLVIFNWNDWKVEQLKKEITGEEE